MLEALHGEIAAYRQLKEREIALGQAQAERQHQTSRMVLVASLLLGLLSGVWAAQLLGWGIVQRVRVLRQNALRIARDQELLPHQPSRDELGQLAEAHDGFRGVPGTFRRAMEALEWAREVGLPTQINTTVTRLTRAELPGIARVIVEKGVATWEVFFLVPVGRGAVLSQLSSEEYEQVMHWLYETSRDQGIKIRTTEGPHFRRVVMQRRKAEGAEDQALVGHGCGVHLSDGNGFVFVSATGEVYPSGFLAEPGGNIRQRSLREIYQHSSLFTEVRDKSLLRGKCGVCEYKQLCGGSRARAWAETGDYLGSDPRCAYWPRGWEG